MILYKLKKLILFIIYFIIFLVFIAISLIFFNIIKKDFKKSKTDRFII